MSDQPVNLFAQQEANLRRSRWLVFWFVLFFAWLGFGGDWIRWQLNEAIDFPLLGAATTLLALGITWHARRAGVDDILWSVGAQELVRARTPEQQQLVNVVEEMAIAAGLPRPRIYLIPDADPNAFATGLTESDGRVAVTEGLLRLCSRDELQAVIAHEIGHIKNYDVRLMTLLAAMVGAIALLGDGVKRMIANGGGRAVAGGLKLGGKGRKNLGPLVGVLLAAWVISWLIAPLVTQILAFSVSRKREYLADAMSAQFTRNPMALATALEKIERSAEPTRSIKRGAAHLCIADPLGRRSSLKEGWLAELTGTHPPMALRVSRLKAMAYRTLKQMPDPVPAA